jgi:tRNA threonylcarbamoyladenosine biosynthesis protein TsaE
MHEYTGRVTVHHFDAWMTGREAAFLEGGAADALAGDGVALVEWAARVVEYLPPERLEIELRHRGPLERGLRLRVLGDPARPDLRAALAAARAAAAEETRGSC